MIAESPKVLIICPQPYSQNSQARTLLTFFDGWDKSRLAQIYFNPETPNFDLCSNYFQITDARMLKRHFMKIETGVIYDNSVKVVQENKNDFIKKPSKMISLLTKLGRYKVPIVHYFREKLWKTEYWKSHLLEKWVDDFDPDIVFFDLTDCSFACEIALSISKKMNIPIVSFICDDYYFNDSFSISPFYYLYKSIYKKIAREIIQISASRIYVCDMIADKYSNYFKNHGSIIYTTSKMVPDDLKSENPFPKIAYLGNLSMGRWKSILELGIALHMNYPEYHIDIYSNETDKKILRKIRKAKGLKFHGAVPYSEVAHIMKSSDLLVHTESFSSKDIRKTKYSLSTKIADCLSCGSCVFAYGPANIGSMNYLILNDCAFTVTGKRNLGNKISSIINDSSTRKHYISQALLVARKNHNGLINAALFKTLISQSIEATK